MNLTETALGRAERELDAARAEAERLREALRTLLGLARDTHGWCECGEGDMCVARRDAARAALAGKETP